jgi:hypothetical protein
VLWLKNFNNESKVIAETDPEKLRINPRAKQTIIPREIDYTPDEFLDFLISQKLNANHKMLKLTACYSDEFAKQLSAICERVFPQLTVIGYKDQLLLGQGKDGNILAGLKPPLVKEEEKPRKGAPGNWVINELKFLEDRDNYRIMFDEDKQQIKFKNGLKLEEQSEQQTEQKHSSATQDNFSSTSNNRATPTRSSPRHHNTASRDSISESILISSQTDAKISGESVKPRRDSTSNIASLLKLSLSPSSQSLTTSQNHNIDNSNLALTNAEVKIASSSKPLPNNTISQASTESKASFDQDDNNAIMNNPIRRRSI